VIEVRRARLPDDIAAITAIDTSFETESRLAPIATERGIDFLSVGAKQTKTFPLDDLHDPDRPWDTAWVVVRDEEICGFAAVGYQDWNRRLALWHFYVDRAARRRALGHRLMDAVLAHAREVEARNIWLETSNLNTPGVAAYKALGFEMTGFDLTLYDGTQAEGEFALFFSRRVED